MPTSALLARRPALVAWTLFVAVLLLVPVGEDPSEDDAWEWLDKPLHALLFAVQCGLLALALGPSMPGGRGATVAFVASGLYGLGLEALQIPVPGRYFEWWDVVADLAGAAMAAIVLTRSRARLRGAP